MIATDTPTKPRRAAPAEQPVALSLLPTAMLKVPTAALVSGLSIATIYRRSKDDPTFPRLHRLGPRCTRIRAGELDAWLAAHAAERPIEAAAQK
jgi:predicted DNA-binding transcriptional regulator AlpA